MSLADRLADRPKPPVINEAPKGFEKAYVEVGSDHLEIVTEAEPANEDTPTETTLDDVRAILIANNLNPDAWTLTGFVKSKWQKTDSTYFTSTKIAAKPSGRRFGVDMPTLDSVVSSMGRVKRKKLPTNYISERTVVGNIADPQIGKTDLRGGTEEFLAANSESLDRWADYLQRVRPEEIILADLGDAFEGIENTAQQAFTNDLSVIDQMDVWGQVFWEWIEVAAQSAPAVQVISVPSNHTALRRGKDYIGRPGDDYGLLIHRFLARQAKQHPAKYDHVSFYAPNVYEESLTVEALSGIKIGFVHGHQFRQVHLADDWWADQTHGNAPLAQAEILNYGHHHHLAITEGRGKKISFGCPPGDPGSAWIRNIKGVDSKSGVFTYTVDANGSYDWAIC